MGGIGGYGGNRGTSGMGSHLQSAGLGKTETFSFITESVGYVNLIGSETFFSVVLNLFFILDERTGIKGNNSS